jgi:protein SCO1
MKIESSVPPNLNRSPLQLGMMVIFAIVALVIVGVIFTIFDRMAEEQFSESYNIMESEGGASVLNPPRPLPDFTLPSHTGDPVSLSDFEGKAVLLSFGYTFCPDVCPLNMMEYRRVRDLLGEQADDTAFVFVSVDGERDTPERLDGFLQARGVEDFVVGLSGEEAEMRRIGVEYGLYFEKNFDTGSEAFYLVDHTASLYLINPDGALAMIFGFGTAPDVIADGVRDQL